MDFGPHAIFVWASYAASLLVITSLLVWLAADGRHQQRELDRLEARGVTRRSSRQADPGDANTKSG